MDPIAAAHHTGSAFWSIVNDPAVSAGIAGILVAVLTFFGKKLNALLGRKLSAEDFKLLMAVADRSVAAAAQTKAAEAPETRKAEAVRIARAFLTAYGLDVSEKQLDAAIEASVLLHS